MSTILILVVVGLVGYAMLKRFNPQATLLTAGLVLLAYAQWAGINTILPAENSQGFWFFDLWEKFAMVTNSRLASTGLTLVAIAGVATYLNQIGASAALVKATSRPIMALKNPYVLLGIILLLVSILYVFITGATSLSLLLMGTLYPLLRNAGISAKTAVATIVIPTAWEFGPGQINAVIGAKAIDIEVMPFVVEHQLPFQIALLVIIPFVNIMWQRYCDRKEGHDVAAERGKYLHEQEAKHENTPGYYALLPLIPFIFLFGFSELFVSGIKMTIPVAMMSTMTLCIIIEALRYRSLNKAFANFEAWLTGTGMIFGSVLTLMLAAEFFSSGLTNIGAISQLIELAKSFELNPLGLSLLFSLFILLTAFITGSGNAPVMAFIPIVPLVATQFDINPLLLLVPILFAAGIGRTISPVAGVIITVAGIANLSSVDVVKRTFVPMMASMAVVMLLTAIRYT